MTSQAVRNALRLVVDACGRTISPGLIQFVEEALDKHPPDACVRCLHEFAREGKFPTLTEIEQKITNFFTPPPLPPKIENPEKYNDCYENPLGYMGMFLAEMPYDSAPDIAETFFAKKIKKLQNAGYEILQRQRFEGKVDVPEIVNGRETVVKRYQIKEHILARRVEVKGP